MADRVSHTPGPWTLERRDGYDLVERVGREYAPDFLLVASSGVLGTLRLRPREGYGDMSAEIALDEANARLIAAAPEMLALVRFAVEQLAPDNGITWLKGEARALLARIEG